MIDIKTGRISFGEGKEIWPGMTREEFINSKLFQEELRHEEEKEHTEDGLYSLKTQTLYGKEVTVVVFLTLGLVDTVKIGSPLMLDYLEWPNDYKYHENRFYEIKRYNDEILSKAIGAKISDGKPIQLGIEEEWGDIKSVYDIRTPRIELEISYDLYDFVQDK